MLFHNFVIMVIIKQGSCTGPVASGRVCALEVTLAGRAAIARIVVRIETADVTVGPSHVGLAPARPRRGVAVPRATSHVAATGCKQ